MGILDGLLRRIGVKGTEEEKREEEVPDLNEETPAKYPGNSKANPNQNTDWFNRHHVSPGSGTALLDVDAGPVANRRSGICPTCNRILRATRAGNSWNHQPAVKHIPRVSASL